MIAALDTAKEMGITYSLCDREVQVTLRRAWVCCNLWSKCKLLATLLSSAFFSEKLSADEIESLKNGSELDNMMTELSGYLPSVKETLIDERDRYLAVKIWVSANKTDGNTLAVIGAGHLQGIQGQLEKIAAGQTPPDLGALETIPPRSWLSKAVKWIIPVLILSLIAVGFLRSDFSVFLKMIRYWILWNGSLAALGCVLALGHPLAILISFAGAPVTSLNPFIGVGILAGLVQATLRKPRVCDAESLSEDSASLKGIYRNRISRALLVFFLSSLGSSIGTFVSIPAIAGLLAR
jgi:pheromone shutdown-related protein TraB